MASYFWNWAMKLTAPFRSWSQGNETKQDDGGMDVDGNDALTEEITLRLRVSDTKTVPPPKRIKTEDLGKPEDYGVSSFLNPLTDRDIKNYRFDIGDKENAPWTQGFSKPSELVSGQTAAMQRFHKQKEKKLAKRQQEALEAQIQAEAALQQQRKEELRRKSNWEPNHSTKRQKLGSEEEIHELVRDRLEQQVRMSQHAEYLWQVDHERILRDRELARQQQEREHAERYEAESKRRAEQERLELARRERERQEREREQILRERELARQQQERERAERHEAESKRRAEQERLELSKIAERRERERQEKERDRQKREEKKVEDKQPRFQQEQNTPELRRSARTPKSANSSSKQSGFLNEQNEQLQRELRRQASEKDQAKAAAERFEQRRAKMREEDRRLQELGNEKQRLKALIAPKLLRETEHLSPVELCLRFASKVRLPANPDPDSLRKALKRAMAQYHPDRATNLSPKGKVEAEVKFSILNSAYTRLNGAN